MIDENNDTKEKAQREWLPPLLLKFLVFLILAFVVVWTALKSGGDDFRSGQVWVIVAGMACLLLLLVIDRLEELRVSPTGLQASLSQSKARALESVGAIEDGEARSAALAGILQARSVKEVRQARDTAIELNAETIEGRVEEAINERRKIYVRYRADEDRPMETYMATPLDLKPSKTRRSKASHYLWVFSYKHNRVLSLLLGKVLGVEISEDHFEPADITKNFKEPPEWNIPRDW